MVEVQRPPSLPLRSSQGGRGTGRHGCDPDRAAVAGLLRSGTLDGPRVALAHHGLRGLPRRRPLPPCPYVAAAFPVPGDGRNTIVPDNGTAWSVTEKPPWSLGEGHAVATWVQMLPAAVSCT